MIQSHISTHSVPYNIPSIKTFPPFIFQPPSNNSLKEESFLCGIPEKNQTISISQSTLHDRRVSETQHASYKTSSKKVFSSQTNEPQVRTDLSPIHLREVQTKSFNLRVKIDLVVSPELKSDGLHTYFCWYDDDIDISIYSALTREDFIKELFEQIDMLWRTYALAPDEILSLGARRLKCNLRKTFEEQQSDC